MAKRLAKIITMGVLIIMSIGLFAGCGEDIATDRVNVSIKAEYKEKFLAEAFSIDDFAWDNIDKIEYGTWYGTLNPERGWITVHLKKHGKKEVKNAAKHFEGLSFVSEISFDGKQQIQ